MKILNLQDLHVNPKWIDEAESDNARICEVARTEKVNAFCVAGDFFDKSVMANDSSDYKRILQLAVNLQEIAPVFYIKGTPSHDSPGCYAPFELIGWKEINIGKSHTIGDLLIMGLPEINSAFLHNKYPDLSKQEIIEQQYILVNQIIDDYYVPLSISHNGPVHFMCHQHIDGVKFRDDQKPRTSDFVFTEQMLERIKANWIQAGHIHLPQEFKTIQGSYGGSSHITYNDVNFKPGFDIVEYWPEPNDEGVKVHRFDFDKPMRQKINIKNIEDIETIFPEQGVNLWVDIKCDKEFADQFDKDKTLEDLKVTFNLAPLSKITTSIQHEEHTRVDVEEYEKATTLEDLYKLYNPDISESILKKLKTAEDATEAETKSITQRTFQFLDLRVKGSIVNCENDVPEIYVNYDSYKTGANLLVAPNGKGKSVINGMCTPFSCHLPKQDNLKDFFVLKDSSIVRRLQIIETGEIITQKIIIDPTLANPTAKFYMDIDGVNIAAENGNIDPFNNKVTEIFGSIKMFMACAFRGQKENDKIPSLEKAKESDLRQIFTELSGIDRTPIKNFAHEEVKRIKNGISLDVREIETLERDVEKNEDIEREISETEDSAKNTVTANGKLLKSSTGLKSELSELDKIVTENENLVKQGKELDWNKFELLGNTDLLSEELKTITETLKNANSTRSELEKLKKVQTDHTTAAGLYFKAQEVFNKSVKEWQEDDQYINAGMDDVTFDAESLKKNIATFEKEKTGHEHAIKELKSKIMYANKPCEHCGKLSAEAGKICVDSQQEIDRLDEQLLEMDGTIYHDNANLDILRNMWSVLNKTLIPQPKTPDSLIDLKKSMDNLKPDPIKISGLETIINSLKSSESRKTELGTLIQQKSDRIEEITKQITELTEQIKPVDMIKHDTLKFEISGTEGRITDNTVKIGRLTAEIEALRDRLQKNIDRVEKIKTITEKIASGTADRSEWEIVEADFSPKGIPAMELSMVAPEINREANNLLADINDRFHIEVITQDLDSKNNIAEKFKILVYDKKSPDVKNLPNLSPGQLTWALESMQEAISKVRSRKSGITYLWSIKDESDGALDKDAIIDFYKLMDRAMDGKRKMISVTHNPFAEQVVDNIVHIEDFFVRVSE